VGLGVMDSEADVREALRLILARQDMMEARQAEVMNQLEALGRQVSVQQQAMQDTLAAAKAAMAAVEKAAVERQRTTPSATVASSTDQSDATNKTNPSAGGFIDVGNVATDLIGNVGNVFSIGDSAGPSSEVEVVPQDDSPKRGKTWYRPWGS